MQMLLAWTSARCFLAADGVKKHCMPSLAGAPCCLMPHAASRVAALKPALLAALLRTPAVVAQRLVGLRLQLPACDVKELVLRDPAILLRVRPCWTTGPSQPFISFLLFYFLFLIFIQKLVPLARP